MTLKEKILKEFPDANIGNIVEALCVDDFGCKTEASQAVDKYEGCFMDCNACFNSEIVTPKNEVTFEEVHCSSYVVEFGQPRCYGTRDRDVCSCGGIKSKCDIYPQNREGV